MRPYFEYLKNLTDQQLTGVEVGVKKGENAVDILAHLDIKQLYLVDCWKAYGFQQATGPERKVGYMDQAVMDRWKAQVEVLFEGVPNVQIVEEESEKAALWFRTCKQRVDFVYIDAGHTFHSVLSDCHAWLGAVKAGGMIGGHDFNNEFTPEVKKAAFRFAEMYGKDLFIDGEDWWIHV